jgi:hypothetical protein
MKGILRGAGLTEDGLTPGTGRSAKRTPNRPILGTRLVRTWRGDRHEVTVVQGTDLSEDRLECNYMVEVPLADGIAIVGPVVNQVLQDSPVVFIRITPPS